MSGGEALLVGVVFIVVAELRKAGGDLRGATSAQLLSIGFSLIGFFLFLASVKW